MKYTLIQTYPGYETLGITHCSENKTPEWRGTNFYDAHPTYWQKVEEVDYDITEVKYFTEIRFLHNGFYRIYKDGIGFELDYLLKHGGTIHSVKRLSDGEVFIIGDKCKYIDEIESFRLQDNKIIVSGKKGSDFLNRIKRNKELLFTTEDGVDIFENDKYFFINNGFQAIISFAKNSEMLNYAKTFSTKEKAKEYILLNKPCLSLNEISTVLNSTSPLFGKIIELTKSKL